LLISLLDACGKPQAGFNGQQFRILTLVDNFCRESLAIRVGQRLAGDDVVRTLEYVTPQRGVPKSIRVDNGPEFISKRLDLWAYCNKVELAVSRPGKPTGNAFIETFNRKFREVCLNEHWFLSPAAAQQKSDEWRQDYNGQRLHSGLGDVPPVEFAATHQPVIIPGSTRQG
jgi:putative transposase